MPMIANDPSRALALLSIAPPRLALLALRGRDGGSFQRSAAQ
jgi:hypothetical protein